MISGVCVVGCGGWVVCVFVSCWYDVCELKVKFMVS